ncbi:MAG: WG repeat-containing protein [Bacteroidota bacterium]|nr:WG repeat-containing protein [Bacteroidota bacterium]
MNRLVLSIIISTFSLNSYCQQLAAPAKTREGWGYIRKDLTWMVPPSYDRFWQDGDYVDDEHSTESVLWEFQEGMAGIRIASRWGFVDTTGFEVIKHQYKEVRDFSDSVAAVLWKGK